MVPLGINHNVPRVAGLLLDVPRAGVDLTPAAIETKTTVFWRTECVFHEVKNPKISREIL